MIPFVVKQRTFLDQRLSSRVGSKNPDSLESAESKSHVYASIALPAHRAFRTWEVSVETITLQLTQGDFANSVFFAENVRKRVAHIADANGEATVFERTDDAGA